MDQQKADEIVALDVTGIANFTDFFVICTGHTHTHLRSIEQSIGRRLREIGIRRLCENRGLDRECEWIVIDYGDVVVHIFEPDKRKYYALERLWGDSQEVDWPQAKIMIPASK